MEVHGNIYIMWKQMIGVVKFSNVFCSPIPIFGEDEAGTWNFEVGVVRYFGNNNCRPLRDAGGWLELRLDPVKKWSPISSLDIALPWKRNHCHCHEKLPIVEAYPVICEVQFQAWPYRTRRPWSELSRSAALGSLRQPSIWHGWWLIGSWAIWHGGN